MNKPTVKNNPGGGLGHIHLHTDFSDGHITPAMIREAGLDFVAATDHDTPDGYNYLKPLEKSGIEVISGIELSTCLGDRKFHTVVIDMKPGPGFQAVLDDLTEQRRLRYGFMLEHLASKGFDIRCLEKNPEQPPYKHQIAQVMFSDPVNERNMEDHAVTDARDFRKRYLKSGPKRITMKGVEIDTVVRNLGGIYILAHPGEKFSLPDEIPLVEELLGKFTFHGIETKSRKHSADDERFSMELAKNFDLVPVTSNDVHEPYHLNRNFTTRAQLDALREKV